MSVKVKFFANFREIIGQKEITSSADTVQELLDEIVKEHEDIGNELYANKETGELNEFVNVMVNGRRIEMLEGMNTVLKDEDTVAIFPPVAGG